MNKINFNAKIMKCIKNNSNILKNILQNWNTNVNINKTNIKNIFSKYLPKDIDLDIDLKVMYISYKLNNYNNIFKDYLKIQKRVLFVEYEKFFKEKNGDVLNNFTGLNVLFNFEKKVNQSLKNLIYLEFYSLNPRRQLLQRGKTFGLRAGVLHGRGGPTENLGSFRGSGSHSQEFDLGFHTRSPTTSSSAKDSAKASSLSSSNKRSKPIKTRSRSDKSPIIRRTGGGRIFESVGVARILSSSASWGFLSTSITFKAYTP